MITGTKSNYNPQDPDGIILGVILSILKPLLDTMMDNDSLKKLKDKYKINVPNFNLTKQSDKYSLDDLVINLPEISNFAIKSSGDNDCDPTLSRLIEFIEKNKELLKSITRELDSKLEDLKDLCNGNDGALDILIQSIKDLIEWSPDPEKLTELVELIFKIARSILVFLLKVFINVSDPIYLGYRDTVKWLALKKIELTFMLVSIINCYKECPYLNEEKRKNWEDLLSYLYEVEWDSEDYEYIEEQIKELQNNLNNKPCPKLKELGIKKCPLLEFNPNIILNGIDQLSSTLDNTINPFIEPINTLMTLKIPAFAGQAELNIGRILPRKYPLVTVSAMEAEIWKRLSFSAPGWNKTTTYNYGSIVIHNKKTYVLIAKSNTGTVPGTSPRIWKDMNIYNEASYGIEPPSGDNLIPNNPSSF